MPFALGFGLVLYLIPSPFVTQCHAGLFSFSFQILCDIRCTLLSEPVPERHLCVLRPNVFRIGFVHFGADPMYLV